MPPNTVLKLRTLSQPGVVDTTSVGGSSYQFHAAHAKRDIAAGKAKVALLTYGSTAHSNARAIGDTQLM